MADASDSKSDEGDLVWVQVPSPALEALILLDFLVRLVLFLCLLLTLDSSDYFVIL